MRRPRKITSTLSPYVLSHNISGGNFKLPALNALLLRATHELICVEETWLQENIFDVEILGKTLYQINRMDRRRFDNERRRGGGVITCHKTHLRG